MKILFFDENPNLKKCVNYYRYQYGNRVEYVNDFINAFKNARDYKHTYILGDLSLPNSCYLNVIFLQQKMFIKNSFCKTHSLFTFIKNKALGKINSNKLHVFNSFENSSIKKENVIVGCEKNDNSNNLLSLVLSIVMRIKTNRSYIINYNYSNLLPTFTVQFI